MLRLTKKTDYGLIALMYLTRTDGGRSASAKEIADAHSLPLPLLAKVLQKLAKGGFLVAVQGTNGGYRLARRPDSISALDVIRAIDGPVFLTSCSTTASGCFQTTNCTARKPLERIREDIFQLLAGITLTEMSSGGRSEPPLVNLKAAGNIL